LDAKRTKTLMDHYLDLQASESESDGLSTSSESDGLRLVAVQVGTHVRIKEYSLGPNYESNHTFYDGEVEAIRPVSGKLRLKGHEYKCVFSSHATLNTWYSQYDTQAMAKAYLEHHRPNKADAKSNSHRIVIREACAMVGRVCARPAPYAKVQNPPKLTVTEPDAAAEPATAPGEDLRPLLDTDPFTWTVYKVDEVSGRIVPGKIQDVATSLIVLR
jgi:hypothetical protein